MPQYGGVRKRPDTITSAIRKDPVTSRDVTGFAFGGKFKGADPTKRYVGVFARDEDAIERYLSEGYTPETYRPDGIKPLIGATGKDGDPVTYKGNIIMSIPIAEYKRQQAERQSLLDAARMSLIAKRDEDSRFMHAAGAAGIRIDKHEIQVPLPNETIDGGNNG